MFQFLGLLFVGRHHLPQQRKHPEKWHLRRQSHDSHRCHDPSLRQLIRIGILDSETYRVDLHIDICYQHVIDFSLCVCGVFRLAKGMVASWVSFNGLWLGLRPTSGSRDLKSKTAKQLLKGIYCPHVLFFPPTQYKLP